MHYNSTYFNCNIDNSCEQRIGYTRYNIERYIFISLSALSVLSNIFIIIYNLTRNIRSKNRKASMRRIFLIFPFTDLITSIYWLISWLIFYNLEEIQKKKSFCSLISVAYIEVNTFQFTLINFLLVHFRKINKNPLEGILKPNRRVIKYIIICFIFAALVSGLSERFEILGRSSLNTCFINFKYAGLKGYIIIIPIICIIFAIIQLFHDLFFMSMFNSDKGIRTIHRKNSCYVFIFCLLNIPLIIVISLSLILNENNFLNNDNNHKLLIHFIRFSTCFTCLIPLIICILRQIQGLSRFECINECIKRRKRAHLLNSKALNSYIKLTASVNNEPSLSFEPFEWLEKQVLEYFMRDILLGVAVSLKKSKKYEVYSSENSELDSKDFKKYSKYEINFENYMQYDLNDDTIEKSEYLNVKIIDYAPKCFSFLRRLEKIDTDKMIESFLPKNNSQGIKKSQGKSGSFFISTDDNKYMIKTLKSDELELLKHAFLTEYIEYIRKNPNSLLCRLYGMYNIILGQGDEILIIVMRNVIGDFKDNTIVKFDLKGSTYKRKSNFDMGNNNNVMKDLDFIEFEKSVMLSLTSIKQLREITTSDSKFLCKSELMDYSLFLVKLTLSKEEAEDIFGSNITEKQNNDFLQIISDDENINNINKVISYNGPGNLHDIAQYKQYLFPSLSQGTAYIISIIDYFQIFNFFKYVESGLKTNFFRQNKKKIISCVDPLSYSNRFIQYINTLTDVKQFLSNDIKEAPKKEENEEEEELSDDDSEEGNILFKKSNKSLINFINKHKENDFILPIEDKPEIQSYAKKNYLINLFE